MKSKKMLKAITSAASAAMVFSVSAMNAFAEGAASTTGTVPEPNYFTQLVLPLIVMFALLYFLFIRPQKKRDNELKEMQNNLQIGDEVVTSGGIIGIVVRKGDDNVVIETGGEKNKIRIKSYAIAENVSAVERAKEAQAAKKSAAGLAQAKLADESEPEKKEKKSKKNKESEE